VACSNLDCVQRTPLPSPSPITVAHIGATVHPLHLQRIPLPPLPSRFLLSPAKWMDTLRRIPSPQPLLRPHARALGILRGGCSRRATVRLAFVSLRALSITHPVSPHQIRPLPARLAAGPVPRRSSSPLLCVRHCPPRAPLPRRAMADLSNTGST
jgi:hypothetical protein